MDNLPYGDHVLVVKNTAEKDMFLLDYVEIGVPGALAAVNRVLAIL